MMTQTPETVRLLPLEVVEADASESHAQIFPLYEFEPDAGTVLDALLPVYIQSRIFNALLQSSAAKHAATQKAMKSASDNADKLITDYTRLRNNARQAEITQQIAEIVGGADALVLRQVDHHTERQKTMTPTAHRRKRGDRRSSAASRASPVRSSTSSSRTTRSPTSTTR